MTTHPELQAFGKQLQALRKDQGLSQEELAERCGLHRTYIGGIERGERNVALLNILRIAAALNIPPTRLLEGLGSK
jgi:transcriptional regulator with XRE-family HTH domain